MGEGCFSAATVFRAAIDPLAIRFRWDPPMSKAVRRRDSLRCRLRSVDELRDPFVSPLHHVAVHRLILDRWKAMGRWTLSQGHCPGFQPRELVDMADLSDPLQEEMALQEWRIGGIHQGIAG